uniref:Small ribosomal subunit protein uS8c n=1 Tax=Sciaphila densiflora TaxID=548678 RepID=A0A0K0QVB3_9LILI|nr:ribosomal protein S8 [Sciaphila densiflora]AKR17954.1 ribosomal protein S8 [Sciaphila densiflora]
MSRDTIANIITSIRNADINKKGTIQITSTKKIENIVTILLREGFIENARKHKKSDKNFLVLNLHQHRKTKKRAYRTVFRRISRPGLRVYSNYKKIPKILGGMGIGILSTPRGIMTDREARLERIGGEILCYIW